MNILSEAAREPSGSRANTGFHTEVLQAIGSTGKRIQAYLDIPIDRCKCKGIVIVAPAYGETKEDNLLVSSYFAANGYYGLRFDWTDHVGESEGDIFSSTLSKMREDLESLVDYAERQFEGSPIGIVASSLAARVALKTLANDARPTFFVCLTPIVNLQATLSMIYREDLVGSFGVGKRYGTLNILGFSIDADNFLNDSIQQSFADISSAVMDAQNIQATTFFIIGQRDAWVRTFDAKLVFKMINAKSKELLVLPKMLHRLLENPQTAKGALNSAIRFIANKTTPNEPRSYEVLDPLEEQVRARKTEEKEYLKQIYSYSRTEERNFWKEYLSNFQYIINVHDFYNLLECIYTRLGGAWPGQNILDAGCGIGNYGLFLLTKQLYRVQQTPQLLSRSPIRYFGVDFVQSATSEAMLRMTELLREYRQKRPMAGNHLIVESNFVVADLDTGIPFPTDFFDQVCCNLVISYLRDPKEVLRELWRVLRPGGRMAVTSLKPGADLSQIYRNFISVAQTPREIEEGRKLLSNAGMIRIKEVRGLYQSFTEKDLRDLVRGAGFFKPRFLRSFGDQANVIVSSKL
jgi:SAM-dependent methyltransferase/esterase/lipase